MDGARVPKSRLLERSDMNLLLLLLLRLLVLVIVGTCELGSIGVLLFNAGKLRGLSISLIGVRAFLVKARNIFLITILILREESTVPELILFVLPSEVRLPRSLHIEVLTGYLSGLLLNQRLPLVRDHIVVVNQKLETLDQGLPHGALLLVALAHARASGPLLLAHRFGRSVLSIVNTLRGLLTVSITCIIGAFLGFLSEIRARAVGLRVRVRTLEV